MAGIYIHIPFCQTFCIYCSFYSERGAGAVAPYFRALRAEAVARKGFFAPQVSPETLYIGGGTPSLVPVPELARMVPLLQELFGVAAWREFTLEANPDDVTLQKAEEWASIGVNRVSLGVQSFCDDSLRWMRRRHSARQAAEAFHTLRRAGFTNISLDLIFGYATLSDELWRADVETLLELRPEHISCYQMGIEEGSALWDMVRDGLYREPSDERCSGQYAMLQEMAAGAGYHQYEISNFALPGYEALHNGSYWRGGPYLGLGPGAHSFDGDRIRSWNAPDLEGYLKRWGGAGAPPEPLPEGEAKGWERLSDTDIYNETVMLSLRTTAGLDLGKLNPRLLEKGISAIEKGVEAGVLERSGSVVRIPSGRFFQSDAIMASLFL